MSNVCKDILTFLSITKPARQRGKGYSKTGTLFLDFLFPSECTFEIFEKNAIENSKSDIQSFIMFILI